jgi:hypothetical protein
MSIRVNDKLCDQHFLWAILSEFFARKNLSHKISRTSKLFYISVAKILRELVERNYQTTPHMRANGV